MKFCLKCFNEVENETCVHCGFDKSHEWFIHYVSEHLGCDCCGKEEKAHTKKDESPEVNIHTHGLFENYNHPDLQLCLPLNPNLVMPILNDLGMRIKNGEKFEPRKKYDDVIHNFDVTFYEAMEEGRKVLRLILPDEKGCLSKSKINKNYVNQFKGVLPCLIK